MPNSAPIGSRLRQLRDEAGLTRRQLSDATQVSVRTIARIELENRLPRVVKLQALARALNVSVAQLLDEERGAA